MRYIVLALAAAATAAVAKPHGHAHRHVDAGKRANVVVPAAAPVETVIVYELNGHLISEDDVRNGIANGTLSWGEDGNLSSSIVAAPTPAPTVETQSVDNNNGHEPDPVQESPAPASASTPSQQPESSPSDTDNYSPVQDDGSCPDCDKEFPNGKLDCGSFPFGYGAIGVASEGLGQWTGLQAPANGLDYGQSKRDVGSFFDIMTVPTGSCPDGSCCSPGRFCSYTCPNPYLKMAWPKAQGSRKESVGGLFCNKHNKLEMPDGSLAKTLCGRGSNRMKVQIQSKLSKPVSVCRTDYPGETKELANPDQSAYYEWDGKATSAQYYVNNQGVEEKRACTWGNGQGDDGNRAPVNIGTSFVSKLGVGFPALFQNKPTNPDAKLNFAIRFTGEGIMSPCSYKNGVYSGDGAGPNANGCTVSSSDKNSEVPADRQTKGKRRRRKHSYHRLRG